MSKIAGGSGVARIAAVGVVVVVGAAVWLQFDREDAGVLSDAPDVTQATVPVETPDATVTATDTAPSFDEVRQETDGMTVIAGSAAPGAAVKILQDGQEVANATADGSGKFAAIALLAPDGQGHVISLSQEVDAVAVPSKEQIILAPVAPVVPAEVVQVEGVRVVEQADAIEAEIATAEIMRENSEPSTIAKITDEAAIVPDLATPQDVAVLKTTDQGVELLNTPRPEAMENVALDTISYSDTGEVQLAGRAQADTRNVRVYLNNNAVINLPVDATGRWRGDLPNVDEGIYTLRVDEVSQGGAVTSRVETPFKRESPAVLALAAASEEGPLKQITVQKGATLWAIAEQRYGDGLLYVNVFKANDTNIKDPNLIYPGQVFELPE